MVGSPLLAANMDFEIKEEFSTVRADLRHVDERVREVDERVRQVDDHVREVDGRVRQVDDHVREVDERVRQVDDRVREVDTRLSAEIRRVEATLRQEIRDDGIATRRHFDVVAESLRDDIRIIAEGFIALDAKVETIRDSG